MSEPISVSLYFDPTIASIWAKVSPLASPPEAAPVPRLTFTAAPDEA
jgi:hypothetical protein